MAQSGAAPEEINAALTHYLKGQVPEGQDPAKGLIIAWGNFFGVPLDVVLSNEQMTPQKAAEIVAGGIPTSEAKLIQFAAAKAYLSLNKYATKEPSPQLPNRVAEKRIRLLWMKRLLDGLNMVNIEMKKGTGTVPKIMVLFQEVFHKRHSPKGLSLIDLDLKQVLLCLRLEFHIQSVH
ncbi:hypothetical protein Ppb6_03467 [Photorhabdus australis subsp. thailandensis]|uniref:Uncharacterized protein n=1 Tax=Photorhabdus australis subsp. thailandensis TaxID=2805096 RepID=A0A1C0U069_9GAMM|nr:hypothetical protein [Photorhabdus australis]OCQ51246.1 hypothetical protein Ppb6_03467 [Photorhabdus australis subsp. thailandensis]